MGNSKKYNHINPKFSVLCIETKGTKWLHPVRYNVIDEDETRYLIQFNSGGAKWYAKYRFANPSHKIVGQYTKPKIINKPIILSKKCITKPIKEDENFNRLF